jgi:hypothetical protein
MFGKTPIEIPTGTRLVSMLKHVASLKEILIPELL